MPWPYSIAGVDDDSPTPTSRSDAAMTLLGRRSDKFCQCYLCLKDTTSPKGLREGIPICSDCRQRWKLF